MRRVRECAHDVTWKQTCDEMESRQGDSWDSLKRQNLAYQSYFKYVGPLYTYVSNAVNCCLILLVPYKG